ncbi:hypothetical protein EKN54_02470 [Enterobacter hormaechei]|uniref:hypothetical protein n=1 Tax=Enterobacter hormaechei TaxID=158836 RepID=UPI000F895E46|nr:hypothetical protein [Enterobacter hormaechei]MCE1444248.1 hypothetical protein [Enterobacter hormaechei]MCE1452618.1 hypothetical protein [Enterobacter hormaechei]RTO92202.1 hypothetical protein EKN54_02470 [Enterobacter hormaechei]
MKLFEMEGFLRGKCIPRDLKVNETNAEYLVRKFAEADAMCAALAAENAGLKESRKNLAEFIHEELDADYSLNMDVETPATDAFLAEVRAQGVEMFAAHKRERQQALRSRSMRMSEEAAGMAADAENFADELRKGVQL